MHLTNECVVFRQLVYIDAGNTKVSVCACRVLIGCSVVKYIRLRTERSDNAIRVELINMLKIPKGIGTHVSSQKGFPGCFQIWIH